MPGFFFFILQPIFPPHIHFPITISPQREDKADNGHNLQILHHLWGDFNNSPLLESHILSSTQTRLIKSLCSADICKHGWKESPSPPHKETSNNDVKINIFTWWDRTIGCKFRGVAPLPARCMFALLLWGSCLVFVCLLTGLFKYLCRYIYMKIFVPEAELAQSCLQIDSTFDEIVDFYLSVEMFKKNSKSRNLYAPAGCTNLCTVCVCMMVSLTIGFWK